MRVCHRYGKKERKKEGRKEPTKEKRFGRNGFTPLLLCSNCAASESNFVHFPGTELTESG